MDPIVRVGVAVILLKGNKILLGKRQNTLNSGVAVNQIILKN